MLSKVSLQKADRPRQGVSREGTMAKRKAKKCMQNKRLSQRSMSAPGFRVAVKKQDDPCFISPAVLNHAVATLATLLREIYELFFLHLALVCKLAV
jgi:hypothetical protein